MGRDEDRGGGGGGDGGGAADGGGGPVVPEYLGAECEGACGSADDRKCAISSPDCPNDLCLIDPGHPQITYCTVDCGTTPCPPGYHCEDIVSFGDRDVTRGCVAELAVCGDGVVQLGEVCDGDSPEHGRCVDCAAWAAVCGDGSIQEGEVCDGDTADAYCYGCGVLIPPSYSFDVWRVMANAVERADATTTWFYGASTDEDTTGELRRRDGAAGCGEVRVTGSDETLTHVEWKICSDDGDTLTWAFALPRAEMDLSVWDGSSVTPWDATAVLAHRDGARRMQWTTSEHLDIFELRVWQVGESGLARGHLRVRLEQNDPIQSFTIDPAELELDFEIRHPVL